MQFPDELPDHPARNASVASMTAIENGDRATWLSLFAPDAVVADPIGPSPLDPEGNGHQGLEAIAAFYDTVIGPNQVRFTIKESWEAGNEVANVGRITTTMADGLVVHTDGVFTYRIDDAGRVEALRAYWSIDRLTYE